MFYLPGGVAPKPAEADPDGAWYTFERGTRKTSGEKGWADVWMRGRFGWEYKGKHRDLAAAYQQLLLYREFDGLAEPKNLEILRNTFTNPDALRPGLTRESVTGRRPSGSAM